VRHFDGYDYGSLIYEKDSKNQETSHARLSFLVYLNEDFEGGHTTFFSSKGKETLAVKPTTGNKSLIIKK
jgi:hypothetical protein